MIAVIAKDQNEARALSKQLRDAEFRTRSATYPSANVMILVENQSLTGHQFTNVLASPGVDCGSTWFNECIKTKIVEAE